MTDATIAEEGSAKLYTDDEFPVDNLLNPVTNEQSYDEEAVHRLNWADCWDGLQHNTSERIWRNNTVSLTKEEIVTKSQFHAKIPAGNGWLGWSDKSAVREEAGIDDEYNPTVGSSYDPTWPLYDSYFVDSDCHYYSFDLYDETKVTLIVSSSSDAIGCSLDRIIYKTNDYSCYNEYENMFSQTNQEADTVCYTSTLKPGSYLIKLDRSEKDSSGAYLGYVDYALDFYMERQGAEALLNVADLKYNKNLGAAIWSSTYRPLGEKLTPTFPEICSSYFSVVNESGETEETSSEEFNYYVDGGTYCYDYSLDKLRAESQDCIIPSDIVYIWDKDILSEIYDFLLPLASETNENYSSAREKYDAYVSCYNSITSRISDLVSVITCLYDSSFTSKWAQKTESIGISLLSTLILKTVFFPYAPDEDNLNAFANYGSFLYHMIDAIRPCISENAPDTYVFQFPIGYRLHEEGSEHPYFCRDYLYRGSTMLKNYTGTNLHNFGWEETELSDTCAMTISSETAASFPLPGTFVGIKTTEDTDSESESSTMTVLGKIESFPEEYRVPIELASISEISTETSADSGNYIYAGDYRWFSYKASKTAGHAIIITSENPITLEIFNQQVIGYSTDGRIGYCESSMKNSYHYDFTTDRYVCFYDLKLKKNQTIYIRARGLNSTLGYYEAGYLNTYVSYENGDGTACSMKDDNIIIQHQHTYGDRYRKVTNLIHQSSCWKDEEYLLEDHSWVQYYNFRTQMSFTKCSKCGCRPDSSMI